MSKATLIALLSSSTVVFGQVTAASVSVASLPEPQSSLLIGIGLTAIGYLGARRANNRRR